MIGLMIRGVGDARFRPNTYEKAFTSKNPHLYRDGRNDPQEHLFCTIIESTRAPIQSEFWYTVRAGIVVSNQSTYFSKKNRYGTH